MTRLDEIRSRLADVETMAARYEPWASIRYLLEELERVERERDRALGEADNAQGDADVLRSQAERLDAKLCRTKARGVIAREALELIRETCEGRCYEIACEALHRMDEVGQ